MPESKFSTLPLAPTLLENVEALGYTTMTPIQALSLPSILSGKDVIGQGKTGSGKTAAFGLGLLSKLQPKSFRVQAMVLCPTRELADQVASEIRALARSMQNVKVLALCGGTPLAPQASSLKGGVHIVVGTPGRIEDHLSRGTLNLKAVQTLVLDEADRMLDMGFQDAIDAIVDQIPKRRQTLLFSATYPPQIRSIAKRVMVEPAMAQVKAIHESGGTEEHFYKVGGDSQRSIALRLLLAHYQPTSALVFCNMKKTVREVVASLNKSGFHALALHGDLDQRQRDQTLVQFTNQSASVLVATDVAARGLDIDALDAVINYEIAQDPDVHLHRIGRTGRAGSVGQAYSLYSDKELRWLALVPGALDPVADSEALPPAQVLDKAITEPRYATLQIGGGKKQKLRPGDILGALTAENGLPGNEVGKIQIGDNHAYVAIARNSTARALRKLSAGKLKGRSFRVRQIGN